MLKTGGKVFKDYVRNSKKGSKNIHMEFATKEEWLKYLTRLWEEALKQKIIKTTMNKKRSNVYSVLKNRFIGKVKTVGTDAVIIIIRNTDILTLPAICADAVVHKLVMPTLESLQKKSRLPKVYYILFHVFVKAAMLDEKAWKSAEEDGGKRFATANIEAHVLSVLEDNYFGWLYDAKQSFGDHQDNKLLTEYHLPDDAECTPLCDWFLGDNVEVEYTGGDEAGTFLLIHKVECPEEYERVKEERIKRQQEIAKSNAAKRKPFLDDMREKLLSHHNNVLNTVGGGDNQEDVTKENHKRLLRKRKRNTMSELKTLGGGKENKYLKGLTNEGKRFLDEQAKRIKNEEKTDIRKSWEQCYREICQMKCKQKEKRVEENEGYDIDVEEFMEGVEDEGGEVVQEVPV
jgi:hypothetical protein